jgi:membrane-associated phospholipid phosphatase
MRERPGIGTDPIAWPVQMLVGLAGTTVAVVVAYFFIDLPVFCLIRESGLDHCFVLKWLTRPPEVFFALSPFVLLIGLLRRWFGPWNRLEKVAVAGAIATLLAALATQLLKIVFGRAGPILVTANDCSSLLCGIYGFYPFQLSPSYWALPSGHTACTLSLTCVLGAAIPKWRLLWLSISVIVPVMLVVLNHHYVGDVFAGAFIGWAIAGTTMRWLGLETVPRNQRTGTIPFLRPLPHFWRFVKRAHRQPTN